MMRWLQRVLVFSSLILAISCASLNAGDVEISSSWKDEWVNDVIGDCYSLSGVYQPLGEMRTRGNEIVVPSRLEASIFGIDNVEVGSQSVSIEQEIDGPLAAYVNDQEGNVLFKRTFNAPYGCEKPWIVYESNVEGSGDGSPVLSTKTITKMARSKAHGLVVSIQTITVSREWVLSKKTESTEVLHKFSEYK